MSRENDIVATLERVRSLGCEVIDDTDIKVAVMIRDPDGLRPGLAFEQSAEGMNDFRYLQTLDNLATKAAKLPGAAPQQAARQARAFLASIADRIAALSLVDWSLRRKGI